MLSTKAPTPFFACGYLGFSALFTEKTTLSPLNMFFIFIENQLTINVWDLQIS